jgi:hypothetical protein
MARNASTTIYHNKLSKFDNNGLGIPMLGFCRRSFLLLRSPMTRLLEEGIEAVRGLPADRQDMAGELLLGLAGVVQPGYQLRPEQIADLRIAIAQADRGEFATEDELRAVWAKFGV